MAINAARVKGNRATASVTTPVKRHTASGISTSPGPLERSQTAFSCPSSASAAVNIARASSP